MKKYFIVVLVAVVAVAFGQTNAAHAERGEQNNHREHSWSAGSHENENEDMNGSSTKDGHHMGTSSKMHDADKHDGEDDENGSSTEREHHDNGLHLGQVFNFAHKSTEELQSFIDLLRKLIALLLEQRGIHTGGNGEHATSTATTTPSTTATTTATTTPH